MVINRLKQTDICGVHCFVLLSVMQFYKQAAFRIALAGIIVAACVHFINGALSHLPEGIHTTADDASYLRPVENMINQGIWKDNSEGASAYVQRPPLFGIVHGLFYAITPEHSAFIGFLFFLLLHGLALYRLPGLLQQFLPEKTSFLLTLLYASTPCFWGFLSYQITEAISPSLVILLLAVSQREGKYQLSSTLLLLTCIWFLRPVLILLFPVVIPVFIRHFSNGISLRNWLNPVILLLCLATIFSWEYRKARYMGHWGELHPIYHSSNNSLFRPAHASLSNLFRVWETRPEVFHSIAGACWSGDSSVFSESYLYSYLSDRSVQFSAKDLHELLTEYSAIQQEVQQLAANKQLQGETSREILFRERTDSITTTLKKSHFVRYHFLTPVQSAKDQFTKSQLNLEIFQVYGRGNWFVELLRIFCLVLINFLLMGSVLILFGKNLQLRLISLGILLYCFYLFYVQRLNEDRYIIPLLPLLFVSGSVFWWQTIRYIRSRS